MLSRAVKSTSNVRFPCSSIVSLRLTGQQIPNNPRLRHIVTTSNFPLPHTRQVSALVVRLERCAGIDNSFSRNPLSNIQVETAPAISLAAESASQKRSLLIIAIAFSSRLVVGSSAVSRYHHMRNAFQSTSLNFFCSGWCHFGRILFGLCSRCSIDTKIP
jgi:hypothetical protein